jgi:hypothetical protein
VRQRALALDEAVSQSAQVYVCVWARGLPARSVQTSMSVRPYGETRKHMVGWHSVEDKMYLGWCLLIVSLKASCCNGPLAGIIWDNFIM